MPEPIAAFGRNFWLIALVMTAFNASVLSWRARREVASNPSLAGGYRKLLIGYTVTSTVPWLVMGFGMTVGGVPTVWHFFQPRAGNPYVLAFFTSVVALWVLGTLWLFLAGGAEFIAAHPRVLSYYAPSPLAVKLYWLVTLAGGIAGFLMMWTMDVPLLVAR